MDPQEQDGYEGFKSIKDRPPSPFLAPDSGGIIDDEFELDAKQSNDTLKPEDNENNERRRSSTSDTLKVENGEFFNSPTRRRSAGYDEATYTADDFVTAYDEPRVIRRPPNAEIYPDAELKEPERKDPDSKEAESTNKPANDAITAFSEAANRTRERSVSREPVVTASGLDIHSVIGKDGVRMFNALLTAARKDVGLKRAWQLKADIFKCMVKTKLLVDSNKIQLEELEPFKEPLNSLGNLFLQLLADKKKYSFEESAIKPTLFSALCNQLGQMWTKLLEPHMDAMDLAKGQAVVQFLSAPKFIATFLSDSEFEDEKKMMKIHARRILKSKLKPTCVKSKCTKARLAGWSRFCPAHHHARFEHLYEPPNFESFVKADETAEFLSFHNYFFELIFEAPPGLGGPPVSTLLAASTTRHSLSGSGPGSPGQSRSSPATIAGAFALSSEMSPRVAQRTVQERSLLGNHAIDPSVSPLSSSRIFAKERTGSIEATSPRAAIGRPDMPASRPSLSRNNTIDRTFADSSTNLPKRPSLPTASPTDQRTHSRPSPPLSDRPLGVEVGSLPVAETPILSPPPRSRTVGDYGTLNSSSLAIRPILAKVGSTDRADTTTLHSGLSEQPPVLQDRSLAVHVGEQDKSPPLPPPLPPLPPPLPPSLPPSLPPQNDKAPDVSSSSELEIQAQNNESKSPKNNQATESKNDQPVEPKNDQSIEPKNDQPIEPKNDQPIEQKNDQPIEPKNDQPTEPKNDQPVEPKKENQPSEPKNEQPIEPNNVQPGEPKNDKPVDAEVRRNTLTTELKRDASNNGETSTQATNVPPVEGKSIEDESANGKTESKLEVKPPVPTASKIGTGSLGGASGSITSLHHRQGSENTMQTEWNKRLLFLYLDLLRLQASTTVKDRGALSKQIFDKYLHPDAPSCVNLWRHPSPDFSLPKLTQRAGAVHPLLIPINNAMESGLAAVQPGVFAPLLKFIENVLKTAFESFCASAKYKERLEQFRLPEQFLAALDGKQAEQESEDRLWEESCVVRFDPQLEFIDPVNYSTLPS